MFGLELGNVVKDAGVKQCELSKRAGLHTSIVSEILSGKRIPTDAQIEQILRGMDEICEILTVVNALRFRTAAAQKK